MKKFIQKIKGFFAKPNVIKSVFGGKETKSTEWISIKEKLPNDKQEYICYGEDWCGYPIFSAIYDEQGWYIMNGKRRMRQFPTHWKPNLNPPKTVL